MSPKPSTGTPEEANSTPTAEASREDAGEKSPETRFGPKIVEFPSFNWSVDLDSKPPLVMETSTRGTDLGLYCCSLSLGTINGEGRLAPLPSSGPVPSEAECAEQIQTNGTYNLRLIKGARYCAVTREGRTVYVRAVAAQPEGEGVVRLEVTVWELPS